MNFVLNLMNYVLKMMHYAFNLMDCAMCFQVPLQKGRWRHNTRKPTCNRPRSGFAADKAYTGLLPHGNIQREWSEITCRRDWPGRCHYVGCTNISVFNNDGFCIKMMNYVGLEGGILALMGSLWVHTIHMYNVYYIYIVHVYNIHCFCMYYIIMYIIAYNYT